MHSVRLPRRPSKVTQERIASAERKESERDALNRPAAGKNTVENFVGCAVAAHGKKTPVTLIVGLPRKLNGMSLASGCDNVNLQTLLAKPREGWSGKLRRAAATGGGVDYGKEAIRLRLERF